MKKLSLKAKIMSSFLIAGTIPVIMVGLYSDFQVSKMLEKDAISKLSAIRDIKAQAVKVYFDSVQKQVLTFSHNVLVKDATKKFSTYFDSFSKESEFSDADKNSHDRYVQNFYSTDFAQKYKDFSGEDANISALKVGLDDNKRAVQYHYRQGRTLINNTNFSKVHAKYHPSFKEFAEKFEYYDVFLIDIKTGNIVYSVEKEVDFATSLIDGAYSSSNLAEAFRKAKAINDKKTFAFVDYKKYTPSYEKPSAFIASPVWDGKKKIGVVAFQLPLGPINTIMKQRAGMGETGESYLVGQDKLLRSDSFLDPEHHSVLNSFKDPEKNLLKTDSAAEVLAGKTGSEHFENYLGTKVLSAFTPVDVLGLKWGLVAEISEDEAFASIKELEIVLLEIIIGSVIFIGLCAFFLSNSINKFLKLVEQVGMEILEGAKSVSTSSTELTSTSSQLSESATESASCLQETVSSIDEISAMVKRNADAAASSTQVSENSRQSANQGKETVELMIKSINDISASTDEIADDMKKNNEELSKVVTVISEIGEKTKVINDIVFQTKLLSFNASVEAARAGEHGKGFAVVAEEVGNLASMSGKAALEITEMLEGSIKQVTDIVEKAKKKVDTLIDESKSKVEIGTKTAYDCSDVLTSILENVTTVNEMVQEISSASAEQSTGVSEVTRAMQELDKVTHGNSELAQRSSSMAGKLQTQADGLNKAVHELISVVKGRDSQNNESSKESKKSTNSKSEKGLSNVVSIQENAKKSTNESSSLKVVGLDTEIPDASDSRFEDM